MHLPRLALVAVLAAVAAVADAAVDAGSAAKPAPPVQPATGPGGAQARFAAVAHAELGTGAEAYELFEPVDASRDAALPVVVFLHGWSAMRSAPYRDWIDHLVLRGAIVVYPRYQARVLDRASGMTAAAATAVRDAFARLDGAQHARADRARVAFAGHSLGGVIAANLAADALALGLPAPRAVLVAHPGDANASAPSLPSIMGDYATIPAGTLLVGLVGDADGLVGSTAATAIVRRATALAAGDRALLTVHSDAHGSPALSADHLAPLAGERHAADALDWFGYWRVLDELTDLAFADSRPPTRLVDALAPAAMGAWSDGVPIAALTVSDP